MTIKAGSIRKGMYILFKNSPHFVTKTDFMSPGKGSAFMRVKMKNISTGNTQEFTYKSTENIEQVDVESQKMQFLYNDGDSAVFMNPQTFDQAEVSLKLIGPKAQLLSPDVEIYVMFFEEKAIDVNFPPKITLRVDYAEEAVAGNTMGTARKMVKLENGFEISAPIFVKEGDHISIDTETLSYHSRNNK
jgi:elongation factor P